MKSGLKKTVGHLLKNVIRHIKGQHLLQGKKDELVKIEKFKTLDYYRKEIFDGAEYNCIKNRQENHRRPQYLSLDDDVRRLRNYTLTGIAQMDDPYQILDMNEYPRLRDLVVARITLFNAKLGGEPSRLTIKEWNDAKDGVWLDETHKKKAKTSEELEYFEIYKLSYQSGKSVCHMLPTLIPKDSWKAIRKLTDPLIRQMAGVKPSNIYVFPNIKGSNFHVNGWNSVNKVCKQAGLTKEINATQMRHYMSTVFANLDVPETDRQAFYRHMGHSEEINKHVYQCPLAVQEITKVGNPSPGKGVFTSRDFKKGDFLLEYEGELLSSEEGVSRLDDHVASGIGCYVFFFKNKDEKKLSIDGTYSRLKARYVNDGIGMEKNSVMKRIDVDDSPHLALFAVRDIKTGEELRYDYGETSKYLPWRKKSKITNVLSTTNTDEASDDKGESSLLESKQKMCDGSLPTEQVLSSKLQMTKKCFVSLKRFCISKLKGRKRNNSKEHKRAEYLQQLPDLSQHVLCTETIVQDDIPLLPPPPPPPKLRVPSLPPNWEIAKDLEGNVYYYHTKTRQTQWSLPVWDDCNSQNDVDIRTPLDEDKTATRNENTKSVTGNLLSMGTESEVIPPNVTDDSESTMYTATQVPSINEDDLLAKVLKYSHVTLIRITNKW
ncbi:unnamed protein product [Mytilus coruscus]|uniref:SETD8 n=1 Tax=Mytilus coruscus TaxID=42192 RepID=A0A6J8D5J3_MYTCO|nr:unnamed protein product [Mytilus coruscus]